ncbi:hypothetical protein AB0L10_05480 [Streptomyces flaveolus]|uniref:hypothetical protein n=1 Tax=Streptomyces flaveolus TaxID=67297 RepID=UPI00341861D3
MRATSRWPYPFHRCADDGRALDDGFTDPIVAPGPPHDGQGQRPVPLTVSAGAGARARYGRSDQAGARRLRG